MSIQNRETLEPAAVQPAAGWAAPGPMDECRSLLHRKAFRLSHCLQGHPLFHVDTLIGVAQEAAKRKRDLYFDAGEVTVTDKWGNIPVPDLPVAEVIRRIESAGAWVIMKHVESDPRYKAVLDEFADYVRTVAGPEGAALLCNPEMLVLITSPRRVTPFHFDAEVNFLVQLHGSKDVWVCDPQDRSITTEEDIERYYAVSSIAGNYKPLAEERATKFVLSPGDAIHIPSHGAHWVRNHDNVSVSLSLNFEFPRWKQADVYRANHLLRRLGMSPKPPGQSALVDRTKAAVVAGTRPIRPAVAAVTGPIRRLLHR